MIDLCTQWELSDPFRVLHPDTRDFTYVPRAGTNNRSCIDFFICSNSFLNLINKCCIGESLTCNLFDHKPIFLDFSPQQQSNTLTITNKVLNHPRFTALVTSAAVETYLHHAVRADVGIIQLIDHNLMQVGRINFLIRQMNDIEWNEKLTGIPPEDPHTKTNITNEIDRILGDFPDPDTLSELPLSVDPDIFFEVLTNNIIVSLRSFQGWFNKFGNASKADLINRFAC
jgi:hypothetical protein